MSSAHLQVVSPTKKQQQQNDQMELIKNISLLIISVIPSIDKSRRDLPELNGSVILVTLFLVNIQIERIDLSIIHRVF